jgi:ubiquinone/menaquinone biosynthesis C-methylase UbiE
MNSSIDWTVWQNPEVVARFTDGRRAGIPGTAAQFETMMRLLRHVKRRPLRVLDLGCGDGVLTRTLLTSEPRAKVVALDGSDAMLSRFREKLSVDHESQVTFVPGNFNEDCWVDCLPRDSRAFDAIVSGYAIHHSPDDRKRIIYRQVFDLLAPGGVFINIEHVSAATELGEAMWIEIFSEHVAAYQTARGSKITPAEVMEQVNASHEQDANILAPVATQLKWLREIGFVDVDCYWKWFELAVLAGFKKA